VWKRLLKSHFLHRREIIVTIISVSIFVIVLSFSSKLINFWNTFSSKREEIKIETATQKELNNISQQREQIIASGVFINPLKRGDVLEILTTSQIEAKKRNVDVVITDKDGFVFSRSHMPGQQGDNIFQTTIQGINISEGKVVTDVVRGARSPLTLISGSFIKENDKPIGSIIVGHLLNDIYATDLQKEYLKDGEQIVFYTPQEGVVGDSLNDKSKTQLLNTYFSLGSDLISQNFTGISKEIKIGNDYYVIHHIIFSGLEENPGGAFILFPIHHNLLSLSLASFITFLFFVLYFITLFLLRSLYHHKHRLPFLLVIAFVLFISVYFISLIKLNNSPVEFNKTPYLIYNSTIKLEPESDIIKLSSEKTIAIKVSTGGESINAVSAVIKYDPKVVKIIDILTSNSFCDPSFFLEKEISDLKGEVRITCGSPNPGFSGSTGTVAELLVQPLSLMPISLEFTKETQVLANDGLGTNVLRMSTNGYYQVASTKYNFDNIKDTIPIFSLSHPNSNRWYNKKDIKLSWPQFLGGTYYYSLDKNPNFLMTDKMLSTTENNLKTSVEDDGIYYFHLQVKNTTGKTGPISNFKIMIDSTPPLTPDIQLSSQTIKKGEVLRLDFKSGDALSGLQSGFYVNINNNTFLPVNPPFYIPFMEKGEYPIVVRVFDKANNFSDNKVIVDVTD